MERTHIYTIKGTEERKCVCISMLKFVLGFIKFIRVIIYNIASDDLNYKIEFLCAYINEWLSACPSSIFGDFSTNHARTLSKQVMLI